MIRGPHALRLVAFCTRHRDPRGAWRPLWHIATAGSGMRTEITEKGVAPSHARRVLLCGPIRHWTSTMEERTFESAPAGDRCAHCEKALGRVLGAWFGGAR